MIPANLRSECMMIDDKGVSLIEAVAVLGLLALGIAGLARLNLTFSANVSAEGLSVQAAALAVETLEAVRSVRDKNWNNLSNLSPGGTYYLSFSDSAKDWTVVNYDPGKIQGAFVRSFSVYSVSREAATGKIASSGGVYDGDTLKIEASVGWNDRGRDKNIKLTTYLTNF